MPELFNDISNLLDFFLNIIELIALIVSIITFFVIMMNKYLKALKEILSPLGMGLWSRLRVMFICRKSPVKKRAFLEFAILKTGGFPVINSEWKDIINSFKVFYSDSNQDDLHYSIPNCTPLIYKEFSEASARYFNFITRKNVKSVFGIQQSGFHWVINIRIEEAYAMPTCLLTGLLSQYEESWEEFIKRYVSTAYKTEDSSNKTNNILANELYFTFAWLLWGPSYELEYRKYWAGLCQLSYGDESNSIPAIADVETNVADGLRNKFLENEERRYGALISADILLYEKKSFFEGLRSNINPVNKYFYDKIENGDLSFGVKITSFTPCVNYKSKKYYSTAYVWLLFELEGEDYAFKPETSVAFFEHANLADNTTYEFLISTLIDKSLKHFEGIYKDPENVGRRYRLVCAMNDKIFAECVDKYTEVIGSGSELGNMLKDRIILEPKHSPTEVFAAYDEYFSPGKFMEFIEVSLDDPDSITDLGRFYTSIYIDAFKDENERETFDNFLHYLKQTGDGYKYHIVLAKDESGEIIGGCVFDYFKKSNTGMIEFIAIGKDMQSCGMGTKLYTHVLSILSRDAHRMNKKTLEYVCCELDSPEISQDSTRKYIYFWNKNNFKYIDFKYLQPSLSAGKKPVEGLWLTISPMLTTEKEVSSDLILSIIADYMRYAMSIDDPEANEEYRAMKKELSEKKNVELKDLRKMIANDL